MTPAISREFALARIADLVFERVVADYLERMATLEPAETPADNVTHDKRDHPTARRHLQPV